MDILINNAGIMNDKDWEREIAINLVSFQYKIANFKETILEWHNQWDYFSTRELHP